MERDNQGASEMQPLQDVITDPSHSAAIDSDFFSRPPQRSSTFIAGTIMMVAALTIGGLVLVRRWHELPTMAIMQMGLATAAILILWVRAYQIFQRLHELYSQAKSDPSFARSPIDQVFRSAGNLMYATIFRIHVRRVVSPRPRHRRQPSLNAF